MTKIILTDKLIVSTKPQAGKRAVLWDALVPSLALRVAEKGGKSFIIQRRVAGKMVRLTLGKHPGMDLDEARIEARRLLGDMVRGVQPPRQPIIMASSARPDSYGAVLDLYEARKVSQLRPGSRVETMRPLNLLRPKWGSLRVAAIKRRDVIEAMDGYALRGVRVAGNRALTHLGTFFNFCMARDLIEANPCLGVARLVKEVDRDRALDDSEIAHVWRAADLGGWPYGSFVKMLILSGQRRGETALARWADFDLARGIWSIPAAHTKNKKPHRVPISTAMATLLDNCPRFLGDSDATPVFLSKRQAYIGRGREAAVHIREGLKALGVTLPHFTLHDIRRSVVTGMSTSRKSESGKSESIAPPHIVESIVNHVSGFKAGVAGTYNKSEYWDERVEALEKWGEHVTKLVAGS